MEEKKTIYKKLSDIQHSLFVPKSQTNNFGHYNYRSAEDILVNVKPLCEKEGLVLTLHDEVVCMGNGECYLKARAEVFDVDTGNSIYCEGYAREATTQGGMVPAQITGASSSYARKYALNGLFAIDNTKDPDDNDYQKRLREVPSDKDSNTTTQSGLSAEVIAEINSFKTKKALTEYMTSHQGDKEYPEMRKYAGNVFKNLK